MFLNLLLLTLLAVANGKTALLLIDVQDCFLEQNTTNGQPGSLSVPASHIITKINQMQAEKGCLFDVVVRSQDYHPASHISFGSTHGLAPFSHLGGKGGLPLKCITAQGGKMSEAACCPTWYINKSSVNCSNELCPPDSFDYNASSKGQELIKNNPACWTCKHDPSACHDMQQEMWTDHCLQSGDSTFPPSLTTRSSDIVVRKGANKFVDSYSAFMDNTQTFQTNLDSALQNRGVDTIYVAGIATDFCVRWSVRDALGSKTGAYKVKVIEDATAAVQGNMVNFHAAIAAMKAAGATIVNTSDILATACPPQVALSHARVRSLTGGIVMAWLLLWGRFA